MRVKREINRLEKGIESRNNIYCASKREFYEHGYNNSKIQRIVDSVNAPLGLFSYYFKTKDAVVSEIYAEYLDAIYSYLNHFDWFLEDTSLFRHLLASRIYYQNIFSDQNIARFYCEVLLRKSNYRVLNTSIRRIYEAYIADYQLETTPEELDTIMIFDFGSRRELFLNYCESASSINIHKASEELTLLVPKLLMIPPKELSRLLEKCQNYLIEEEFSYIKML